MLDQMEELRSIASGNDYRNSRAGPLSPQPQSVNDPSLYRGYDGASEYGRAGDGVRPSMPLPTPSQRAFETIGSPPLTDVPVISVPGSVVNAQTSRSGPMAMSQLPQSYSATSLGLGLGLVGVAPSASGQPQTPYTQYGGGQSQQQSPYVSRRDGYEDGDYDDEDSYAGARAMDLYSEGIQSPAVPPTSARYDNYGRGRGDYRASSARTHPETDRTMVDYDRRGRSYLADPGPYSQSRAGYPQTPGGARSMVPPDESIDGSRAARYYYKRPSGKPVVWWRRSICHFIGLAMSALCAFWLLNWIFGGMSWTFRSKQISLVVGIESE